MKKIDDETHITALDIPPKRGPRSGRANWLALVECQAEANRNLGELVQRQREVIRELEAENKLFREQIASRKPKGGRDRTPDETIEKIERALEAGHSTRKIGSAYRVSAMTVSRVRKQMKARQALIS